MNLTISTTLNKTSLARWPSIRSSSLNHNIEPYEEPSRPQPPRIPKLRTHVVAPGDTLASIARKYHISLGALQSANPGVSPKKIRAGQTLNLPPA